MDTYTCRSRVPVLARVGDTAAGGPRYWCTEPVEPSIFGDRQSGLGISLLWVRRLFARLRFWSLFRCWWAREAAGEQVAQFRSCFRAGMGEYVPVFM